MAFAQKQISVTIGGGSGGSASLTGLRTSVHIEQSGNETMGIANIRIWGMPLEQMNSLTTIGMTALKVNPDMVTVSAGDSQRGMTQIFSGTIYTAMADFQGGANLPFHIYALAGYQNNTQNIKPTSIQGSAPVSQIMSNLAGQMGLQFENAGVNNQLSNPYFWGSARQQAVMCMRAVANTCGWVIENGTLAIWPHSGSRTGFGNVISPQTGMVGYPSAASVGIKVKVLFNPPAYKFGSQVTVSGSLIQPANGSWTINKLTYDLEAYKPNGQWFVTLELWKGTGGQGSAAPSP